MIDLEPATTRLASIVEGVRDDQLSAATPSVGTTVGDLLDHVDGLALAFTAAAAKTRLPEGQGQASADASKLADGWRSRIPQRLATLARAWRDNAAWTGMTRAGGQDIPGELAGVIALNEVIVHGWDLAVASGQDYGCEPELAEVAMGFARQAATSSPEGTPGLFGPPVPVPAEAPVLDRLLGFTGRDPGWPDRDGHGGPPGASDHSGAQHGVPRG
jgi:uncharacterized protein (TIGR03086 family)